MKISSRDGTERLVRQALPGLGMTYVAKPPNAIPVKLSHHYFLLEKSGNEWEAIVQAKNLAAFVPAEMPNLQLELVILLPSQT